MKFKSRGGGYSVDTYLKLGGLLLRGNFPTVGWQKHAGETLVTCL